MTLSKSLISATAVLALLAGTAFAGSHSAKNPDVGGAPKFEEKNIIENAANSADHTTLVAAVKAAGLVETLQGAGPFTVFAPTDAAFAALPKGTLEKLLAEENRGLLTSILTYHVVAGEVDAATAISLDGQSAATVNGAEIAISVVDGSVVINDSATVVSADVAASNGIIHVIDTVLLPPAS